MLGSNWVHVDPCEAAVDEPLLYQSWGKNQTFILAFSPEDIVDVTFHYTSNATAVTERRLQENFNSSLFDKTIDDAKRELTKPKVIL